MKKRIVLIGAGNVATHLALGLAEDCEIVQVYSRTLAHACRVATVAGAQAIDCLDSLVNDADVYIICVPDDAIVSMVSRATDNGALWLHTSGTTPLSVLSCCRSQCGVLYPMQSFSREIEVNWGGVHIFVEGNNSTSQGEVEELARLLSPHVVACDSRKRRLLHVSAVFSCNFANDLWINAAEILEQNDLPFDAMMPLIMNTVEKLRSLTPQQSQTGPAWRGDLNVINSHLAMLDGRKQEIYRIMTDDILCRAGREQNIL